MTQAAESTIAAIISRSQREILSEWVNHQLEAVTMRRDLLKDEELREQSRRFLAMFGDALQKSGGSQVIQGDGWADLRQFVTVISETRARHGFSASETATFLFSLKQPIFDRLRANGASSPQRLASDVWSLSSILDKLGLFATECYQRGREQVILRQQEEMLELSTPVVELWRGVLALPLIGTLDSARTQIVMESLLQKIVETGSGIAIIDITGVPTVDTLVAQHLLKTVAAARLMGAECIISGIRPQIAQTIVHLGVDLADVITKGTLADAFAVALQRTGLAVIAAGS
jgi:rsbT co-antagonist protein RsbR